MKRMMVAAAVGMTVAGNASFAQSILDQQLGQKRQDVAKPAARPEGTPSAAGDQKTSARPDVPDTVSPDAAKAVDDMDLVDKLAGGGNQGDADQMKQIKQMLDRMEQSQARLTGQDPGAITQETQKRIVGDLDEMIEMIRKNQQSQNQQKQGGKSQGGQKRQQTSGQKQAPSKQRGSQPAKDATPQGGSATAAQSNGEDMHQKTPQEWGNLPPRDRDLISNGANEQYLPSYKEMIDRYYQSLAEIGKSKEK